MPLQEMRTRTATCYLDPDGIIHITYLPGAEETLADSQETLKAATTLSGPQLCPVIVDMRNIKSQDRDARQFWGSPEVNAHAPALALLVASRVSQLIATFFISVTKTHVPTKIFTDEAEALTWLRGFVV